MGLGPDGEFVEGGIGETNICRVDERIVQGGHFRSKRGHSVPSAFVVEKWR